MTVHKEIDGDSNLKAPAPQQQRSPHLQKSAPSPREGDIEIPTLTSSPKSSPRSPQSSLSLKRFDPSEDDTSSGPSTPDKTFRPRPEPLGQSRSRKPIAYDGVYYTGEPLPNRPDVVFPDESRDEYPSPPTPLHGEVSLASNVSSPSKVPGPPPLPTNPPPQPVLIQYDEEPYVSSTISV